MEFTIQSLGNKFRIKKMNAIEALAFRNVVDFDSYETTIHMFNTILEHIEVLCDNTWLPVKEKNKDVFYPAGIEDDLNAIDELTKTFMNDFFKPLFRKSDELKN